MANSLASGDRYIIFGISDPNEGTEIEGVEQDDNRLTQADLLDWFSSVPFAGDIRPEIELSEISINNHIIDILVIKDHKLKPYTLSEEYSKNGKRLLPGAVYTRIGDKNTAINGTADLYHVERMWKQRFRIDVTGRERMLYLLQHPNDWEILLDNDRRAFHKYYPEYQIAFSEPEERPGETFCFYFPNHHSFWGIAEFKYHTTSLFELGYVYCDEFRVLFPIPRIYNFMKEDHSYFFYYIMDSDLGLFFKFLRGDDFQIYNRGGFAPILAFETEDEFNHFIQYADNNWELLKTFVPKGMANTIATSHDRPNALFLSQITQLYDKWCESILDEH